MSASSTEALPARDDPYWRELADEALAHLRRARAEHRRQRQRDLAFYAYVVALFAGFYLAPYTGGLLHLADEHGPALGIADRLTDAVPLAATGLALLTLVAAASDARWRGPVTLDAATGSWLLPAPAAWERLLRPRLRLSIVLYAAAGALGATAAGFLVQIAVHAGVDRRLASVAAAGALLGGLAGGVGGLVERYGDAVQRHARWVAAARGVALLLLVAAAVRAWHPEAVPSTVGTVALWSGPWGWAAQALAAAAGLGQPLLPLALLALTAAAGAAALLADARIATVPGWALRARGAAARGVAAALMSGDPRQARQVVRSAAGSRPASRLPVPRRPRRRRLVLPWRTTVGWLRDPARVVKCLLLLAGAHVAAVLTTTVTGAERAGLAAVALVAAYVAGAQLLEAARIEADDVRPSRTLPMRFPQLVLAHGAAPLALLLLAHAGVVAFVAATGRPVAPSLVLLAGVPALVAGGLVSACRGTLPTKMMIGSDTPTGNTAIVQILVWYARGPLVATVLLAPPILLAGAGDIRSVTDGGTLVIAYGLALGWLMGWWARWTAGRHYSRG
ncbi:DUF6297 family protein [Motilibacter deserti]|uniref:ABC-2 type transport system permease protein n=1 Tax=Motilibacter deserti TaxID=2714956 RepID=A0ABX0GZA5_9ACTN|nr:DUF6297 family protein [Motilibacter deserti]NHC15045.1 hypothetical protein [Motilibacter deserti]